MILLIIIGISFYQLATRYGKNKLIYVLMGLGIALVVQFLIGIIYGLTEPSSDSTLGINLLAGVVSGIVVYLVYKHLEKKAWAEEDALQDEINNIGSNTFDNNIEEPKL